MLFRFGRLSVFHVANIGVVNFHRLWCVFGPFYFLFMHHNLLDEEGPVFLFRKRLPGKTKKQEKIEKALADQ